MRLPARRSVSRRSPEDLVRELHNYDLGFYYDLGFLDHETRRVECAPNLFEAQVLPMSPE
jgi:hypothetical protein